MKLRRFDSLPDMEEEALSLLKEHMNMSRGRSHAAMLTGGKTPAGLYGRLQKENAVVDGGFCLLISDERHVPIDAPESNFGKIRNMVAALGLDDTRVMRVRTELGLQDAADRYDEELASYIRNGGRITLGILGLGADGHAASLFSSDDLERGKGRYAIAVPREDGPDRVSVTGDLLQRVERLVFFVAGAEKAEVVKRMQEAPETVIAAKAVENAPNVELWYSS